jgi:hypothetical protein
MGQRFDLLNAEPDARMSALITSIQDALASDLDPQVLAGLLLEAAVRSIGQIVPEEARAATRQAFLRLTIARLQTTSPDETSAPS